MSGWTPHSYPIQAPLPMPDPSQLEELEKLEKLAAVTTEGDQFVLAPTISESEKNDEPSNHSGQSTLQPEIPTKVEAILDHQPLPRLVRALKDGRQPDLPGRNIIICLDGTGDKFDSDNSSIVHLVSCLKKSSPKQITYYQSGIGTYDGGGLTNGFKAGLDMAVGSGLGVHIRDAYAFLMSTYQENDRICLFGFSRGAYTARCLAGMLHKVGLLPAQNVSQIQFAYDYYKDESKEGWEMSAEFKKTFCMNVSVHFIGVFDSVASVGFIPRKLPLSSTPTNKAHFFRHAIALDEHRAKFKSCRFQMKDHNDPSGRWRSFAELDAHGNPTALNKRVLTGLEEEANGEMPESLERQENPNWLEKSYVDTDVVEVWFTGAHCDVGGGAVKNTERHKLSQIPLRWMIRQCFECDTGIIFKAPSLAAEGIDVASLWPVYQPLENPLAQRPLTLTHADKALRVADTLTEKSESQLANHAWHPEQIEDYLDALTPINDQLVEAKGWWVLEVWPIKVRVQHKETRAWIKKLSINLGRYRPVQERVPLLHWTVQHRMETKGYGMKVRADKNAIWKVVA